MERAHGRLLGFHLIVPQPDDANGSISEVVNDELMATGQPRTDGAHLSKQAGLGRIPRLPRPKFLSAIAEFALGE
jgi:hypothetical protein